LSRLGRLAREPLVHFLLLGAALFALSGLVGGAGGGKPRIVVSAGQIESLAATFQRTWMRPPTAEELEGLVRDYVREEVAYREALALGLDRDDTVIRRRMRQKLEFLTEEVAQAEPGEAELRAYLARHADAFREEDRFTFDQVFLDPDRHGAELARDVERLLAELRRGRGADLRRLSDSTLLETRFENASLSEVASAFGSDFAARLETLPERVWQGPLSSGYGLHLVRVETRTTGDVPPFDRVRESVRREWENEQRLARTDALYRKLLEGYTVTIEAPPAAASASEEPGAAAPGEPR
jgi:hypothetical protein